MLLYMRDKLFLRPGSAQGENRTENTGLVGEEPRRPK
jgi:hypothetical protein